MPTKTAPKKTQKQTRSSNQKNTSNKTKKARENVSESSYNEPSDNVSIDDTSDYSDHEESSILRKKLSSTQQKPANKKVKKADQKEVMCSPTSQKLKSAPTKGFPKELRGYAAGKSFGNNVKVKITDKMLNDDDVFLNDEHSYFDIGNAYIPPFLKEPAIRDAEGRSSNEVGYDNTTVYVPPEEIKRAKPLMKQYWKFKSLHYDKLVAIKVGKFYYFYFEDAMIVHRMIDMKLVMWGKQTFTSFYENLMGKFAPKLVEAGYKLAIVEQVEESKCKEDDLLKRDVCQILTRGTITENQDLSYSSRFMLAIFEENSTIGLVFVDTTTHEFYIGELKVTPDRSSLKTLATRYRPVEVVYMKGFITQETLDVIRQLSCSPVLRVNKFNESRHLVDVFEHIESYFLANESQFKSKAVINDLKNQVRDELKEDSSLKGLKLTAFEKKIANYSTVQALGVCTEFLENVLLAETVVGMGNYMLIDIDMEKRATLYLDSQALENLDILEVKYLNKKSDNGSLYGFMDHAASEFGKRMLKRWIMCPLIDADKIRDRQDAVEDLLKNIEAVRSYQENLRKLKDLERMISRVYNLSNRRRLSVVSSENFAKSRLKDFLAFLTELKKVEGIIEGFTSFTRQFHEQKAHRVNIVFGR